MSIFKECADIQTADMLKLPIPEAEYENVVLKSSEYQKEIVQPLAERAEQVRGNLVDLTSDNMIKITNDGRKLALDQRLVNAMLPDNENSKAAACVDQEGLYPVENTGHNYAADNGNPQGLKLTAGG